jgi:SAM-dependent methyltransferase
MNPIDALQELYMRQSKHSNYQVLPRRLRPLLREGAIATKSRYEHERMAYIAAHVDLAGKSVIDVGANTGYFSFECLDRGARRVAAYEGNGAHAEFLRRAAAVLGEEGRLSVADAYLQFPHPVLPEAFDLGLLMNVLHHVGDDFGSRPLDAASARRFVGESLRGLAAHCSQLVFQLGYCWMGDRSRPLFDHGTKQEQIDFVADETGGHWLIQSIGIAEVGPHREVEYAEPSEANLRRRDDWGEFLNRPLFIMKSVIAAQTSDSDRQPP